jgi:hypothetical protein
MRKLGVVQTASSSFYAGADFGSTSDPTSGVVGTSASPVTVTGSSPLGAEPWSVTVTGPLIEEEAEVVGSFSVRGALTSLLPPPKHAARRRTAADETSDPTIFACIPDSPQS